MTPPYVLGSHTLSAAACMQKLGLSHRAIFRQTTFNRPSGKFYELLEIPDTS